MSPKLDRLRSSHRGRTVLGPERRSVVAFSRWMGAGLLLGTIVGSAGCSGKDHRLSEFEAQEYKRRLVLEHASELSEGQKRLLMGYPARTRAELDSAFESFREEFRRREAYEAALLRDPEDLRKETREDGAPPESARETLGGGVADPDDS